MRRIFTLLATNLIILLFFNTANAQSDCTTAIDISADLIATCNTIAVTDTFMAGGLEDICGLSQAPTAALWYSFVAPFDGLFDVTNTMDDTDGDYYYVPDTQMGVGSGTCGSLVCPPNYDFSVDDGGNGYTSALLGTAMTAGTTYYVEWGDGWGDAPINMDVRIVEAINVSNVTASSADVNPSVGSTCTIEYGLAGFGFGAGTPVAAGSTITGLTPATTYEICSEGCDAFSDGEALCGWTGLNAYSPNGGLESQTTGGVCFEFTTPALCADPTAVSAALNATNPLDIDVTLTSGSGLFDVEYGPAGFTSGSGTVLSGLTTSPYTITGLACGEVLDVYVRDDCGAVGTSFWIFAGTFDNTISGCTDPAATNYNADACFNDGTCTFPAPECGGNFYDSGGQVGLYLPSENTVTTICPDVPGEIVSVTFTYVDIEVGYGVGGGFNGTGCWDYLTIYDGADTLRLYNISVHV